MFKYQNIKQIFQRKIYKTAQSKSSKSLMFNAAVFHFDKKSLTEVRRTEKSMVSD